MALRLVTPPADAPVSLPEAKAHLRVDHTDDDDLIEGLIAAAVQHLDGVEGTLGRVLMEQTWRLECRRPGCREILLDLPPVSTVTGVQGLTDGAAVTLDPSGYRLGHKARGTYVILTDGANWPGSDSREDALQITFTTGAATAPAVPAPIRQAMLLMIGHWYENRGADAPPPPKAALALLSPFRKPRL